MRNKTVIILFFTFLLSSVLIENLNAQIPKSGTYTYEYCDEEYNRCLGNCTIKIKGNYIWIYAPANLSGIKEGELFESGTLFKHASGKWIIIHSEKEKTTKSIGGGEGPAWIDFKRKQFWTF
jgi:hypothetical protein